MKKELTLNSVSLLTAQGIASFLTAVTGILLARSLGIEMFGRFSVALAFAQIVNVVADSGMGMLVAKNISRNQAHAQGEMDMFFTWRLMVIGMMALSTPLFAWMFLSGTSARWVAMALTPSILLLGMTDFYCWIFKGGQRGMLSGLLQVFPPLLLLVLCLIAFRLPHPFQGVLMAHAAAGFISFVVGWFAVKRYIFPFSIKKVSKAFFRTSAPTIYKIGAVLILTITFTRIDILMVTRYCGERAGGLFSSAGRVLDAFRMIPTVALSVFLPLFASFHGQKDMLRTAFRRASTLLFFVALFLAVGTSCFGRVIFPLILGPLYRSSADLFQPLAWGGILMFLNILLFALLYALNDHRTLGIGILLSLGVDILANGLLLPHFGVMAAPWVRLLAESVNFIVRIWALLKTNILTGKELLFVPALIVCIATGTLLTLSGRFGFAAGIAVSATFLAGWTLARHHEHSLRPEIQRIKEDLP